LNPRLKNLLKYSIFFGLAVLLVYLAFSKSDPAKLWADILQADYWWVLLGAFLGYTALISRGYRWLILLEPMGYKPKAWNSVHSVAVLYIVNMAVPRAGEVARCTSLNQVENIPVDKLFGTVILERVVDFVMLLAIMLFTFFMYVDELLQFFALALGNTQAGSPSNNTKFILLGVAAVFGVLFLIFRKRIINHPKFETVRNFWNGMKEGLKTIKTMRRKRAFILHTLYIWSTYFLMVYVAFYAMPTTSHLAWHDAFFVFVAASLGIVVPTPGGIGAYHYLVMLALTILGLSETDGLAYATIVHSSQTLMLLIAGAFGFLFLYLERRKKDTNAAPISTKR
jgi:uncharacterized membrane protein YbhN (UPF0104 family)